ncbi:MAG: molybdopterin-dependent oxidoreductase [Acidobacteria bacterium]|nr:molybdopterin-dependent oxidoreductase [Acidobacteriota bacterium]MBV9144348.1 molybdopterin-dependent oxidoreductase [Acidobacteriota bacterium]
MPKTVHAACSHDCPDSCGVLITVDELGRATRLRGDPAHPVTRGFLCAKVAKYLDRVYSPDRVLHPMRRVVAKGRGVRNIEDAAQIFERISWDEAYQEIARRFQQVGDEFGPEAILPYSYAGTTAVLSYASMDRRFFHRLGASQLDRTICSTTGGEALISVLGRKIGTDTELFPRARYIIAWGANIHGNNVHLWPFIEEARRNGAKLVVIDPYKTRTAQCADWYLPINPGTDGALALGMMHVIVAENLYDADYVKQHVNGFDELVKRVHNYPPHRVAEWTGISAENIVKLTREYATTTPAVIRVNYGVQRCQTGGTNIRAISMLPCIMGAWKHAGGGLQLSCSGAFKLNDDFLERPDLMLASPLRRHARVVNMSELGQALTRLDNPQVKAIFVYNSNPAAIAPNHNAVVRGFMRPDLFTVVHEQFFTDTTDYADIVLPATTFFEQKDLQKAYGHYYLQMSNQAIAPIGESKSNVEIFSELAQRMGFTEPCFRESVDEMIDGALESANPWLKGITREQLEREGHVRLNFGSEDFVPFADGKFPTADGKARIVNEDLVAFGMDAVANFVPPVESRHSEQAKKFPLELLARKADNFLNSSFCNVSSLQPLEPKTNKLEMSGVDAELRGIATGDAVRVFNDRGEVRLTAMVDGAVQPGVVATRLIWSKLMPDGIGINALTSERLTDYAGGPTFYSCLVEVEKAGD